MKYASSLKYFILLVFFSCSFPAYSQDIVTGSERHTKDTWKISCRDYAKTRNHKNYTAVSTIKALAYKWHLPKAEFEEKFIRDGEGELLFEVGKNILLSSANPEKNQFICKDKSSTDETLEVKTKLISYWKVSCTPKTFMSETKNTDHLVNLLTDTVGNSGPTDKNEFDKYVKALFDYNYKTPSGFECPQNDAIRLILWPYDDPGQTAGGTSPSATVAPNCSTIPDKELTTIENKVLCPEEIPNRERQRKKNEELGMITASLSDFDKSITKNQDGKTLASTILQRDNYDKIVGEISALKKEYKNYSKKEISDKLNDISELIGPIRNFVANYMYYDSICENENADDLLKHSRPKDYSDKCLEINSNLNESPINLSYIVAAVKDIWNLTNADGFYLQYLQLRNNIIAYQAEIISMAAKEKTAQEKAAKEKAAQEKAAKEKAAQEKAAKEKAAKEKAAKKKAEKELRDLQIKLDNSIAKINESFSNLEADFNSIQENLRTKSTMLEEEFGEEFDSTKPIDINLNDIFNVIESNISDYGRLITETESLLKSIPEDFDLEKVTLPEDFDLDKKNEEKIKSQLRLEELNKSFLKFSQLIKKAEAKLGTVPESLRTDLDVKKETINVQKEKIKTLEEETIPQLEEKYTFRIYYILLPIILLLSGGIIFLLIRLRSSGEEGDSPTSRKYLTRIQELESMIAQQKLENVKSDKIIKSIIDQKASTELSQDRPGAIHEKIDEKPLDLKEQQRQEELGLYKDYDDVMKDPNLVDQFKEKWKAEGLERESRLATKGRAILRKSTKRFNQSDFWTVNFNNRWIVFGGRILKVQAPAFAANDGRRARDLFKGIFQLDFGDDFRTVRCAVVQKNNQIFEISTEGRLQLPKID